MSDRQDDEQGWSALSFAAGKGDVALIELLLKNGADVFHTGRDRRTPYTIALAAGHVDAARLLRDHEARAATNGFSYPERKYCRAYRVSELRQFSRWRENVDTMPDAASLGDDAVVFVHEDYRVTASINSDEKLVFSGADAEWKTFCAGVLKFRILDDFDLIATDVVA